MSTRASTEGRRRGIGGYVSLTSKRAALLATAGLLALAGAVPAQAQTGSRHRARHAAADAPPAGQTIAAIDVVGNQRIEADTVRSYMLVAPGEPFNQADEDRSLKTLYATGLFHDVSLSRSGDVLIVHVVENPIVNRITFEGNHALTDDKLRGELSLRARAVYTPDMAERDREKLMELYAASGRFAAVVTPQIIRLSQNRVDVVFNVNEGSLTLISRISFVGNHAFSESKLRSVITSSETAWWKFFSNDDEYNPERLNFDKEQLRRFYLRNGYIDFNVVDATAELSPDRKSFFITYTLNEGSRYRVASTRITSSIRGARPSMVAVDLQVKKGQWYDGDAVERSADLMRDHLQSLGFPFADVKPQIGRNEAAHSVDLVFPLDDGPHVYVERIEISGNTRTQDRVIRRVFPFAEGDPYTDNQEKRTKQLLEDLGYFSTVNITTSPGSAPDRTIVNADLAEKATGELTLGGGYSTDVGPLANVGLRQKNFIGSGIDAGISGTIAEYENQVDVSATDPYFLDRNLVAGVDLFRSATNYSALGYADYNETREGGTLRVGYAYNNYISQSWNYSFVYRSVNEVDDGASVYVNAQNGSSTLSQFGEQVSIDTRDSHVEPHKGWVVRLGEDVAGAGGTTDYIRSKVDADYFVPLDYLTGNRLWTVIVKGGSGYLADFGNSQKDLIDNFYLGGDNLRGFLDGGVGPHAVSVGAQRFNGPISATNPDLTGQHIVGTHYLPDSDSLGGRFIYTASAELLFPLPLPEDLGVSGRAFTDAGGLTGVRTNYERTSNAEYLQPITGDRLTPRVSAGVGVSWKSPFGLINVDFAVPLKKQTGDQTQVFRFGFGTNF